MKGEGTGKSRWLWFARAAAWIFVVSVIALFIFAAVQFYSNGLAVLSSILPNSNWTVERMRAALAEIGWTPEAYSAYYLVFTIYSAFWYALVGLLILWRRGSSWFGLLLAVELVAIGVAANSVYSILEVPKPVLLFLSWILWPGFFICFYLFPDGRFVPRWMRWLAVAWAVLSLTGYLVMLPNNSEIAPWLFIPLLVLMVAAPASQIYRYFRVSNPIQKQQTKVVLFAVIIMFIFLPVQLIVNQLYGNKEVSIGVLRWNLVNTFIGGGISTLFPLSIGIAILRYRLWDIDVFIRRTVTYAFVVALLLLVYFGSVILFQRIFAYIVTDLRNNQIVTVLSTLVIAALFIPLRNRIQAEIDKRFNRKKYNAQQVMEKFSRTVRDETDLEKLTYELVNVIQETMQPKSVNVWLKKPTSRQGER